jgi:hypothetical protein
VFPHPYDYVMCGNGLLAKEEKFAGEFLMHDGLGELVDIIRTSHGNTLAVSISSSLPVNFTC